MKRALFGNTLTDLAAVANGFSLPGFTASQLADWLYKKDIRDIDGMTNLSKKTRSLLKEHFTLGLRPHLKVQESVDGTRKYLFPARDGMFVEAAFIPEPKRKTLCISTQVGCKMGCLFCMTGRQGFQDNLSAGDILNQAKSLPESDHLSNIVYMGMGEPLDNLEAVLKSLEILTAGWGMGMSPRRITLSTIGMIPALKTFLDNTEVHLALSLHSPFDEERKKLMPIQRLHPLHEVLDLIKQYDWKGQRRFSIEYIMFRGLNDTLRHVKELVRILEGLRCRINLIRYHQIPDTPLEPIPWADMEKFRDALNDKGITATIRRSRGEDIAAACGMLSTKELLAGKEKDV